MTTVLSTVLPAVLATVNVPVSLGPELWTNNVGFAGLGWNEDSLGVFSCDGSQASATTISMSGGVNSVIGTRYRIEFNVTAYTTGGVFIDFGGETSTPAMSAAGRFVGEIVASVIGSFQGLETVGADFIGTVTNVSIREIL